MPGIFSVKKRGNEIYIHGKYKLINMDLKNFLLKYGIFK